MKKRILILLFGLIIQASARAEQTTSSMDKLFESGQNVSCTFSKPYENGSQNGTIYVTQSKMRGDITITKGSESPALMHIIREGDYSYTWGGPLGETQGIKMQVSAAARDLGGAKSGPEMSENMNFECSPWSVDESKFTIPSDVQFNEMGSLMPAGAAMADASGSMGNGMGGIDMRQMQCAACDQAGDESTQAQCKQMLGCS